MWSDENLAGRPQVEEAKRKAQADEARSARVAEMEKRADAMVEERERLDADPEVQALRARRRAQAESQEFREQLEATGPRASFPHAEGPYTPDPTAEDFEVDEDRAAAAQALALTTLRPDEVGDLAANASFAPEDQGVSRETYGQRFTEIYIRLPDIQTALEETGGDLTLLEAEYPEIYRLIHPVNVDGLTPEERQRRAREQFANAVLSEAWKQGFSAPAGGILDKKARAVRLARELGVDPTVIVQNYDEIEAAVHAADFDPEKLREQNPVLWRVFARDPRTGSIGLHDPRLRPGWIRDKLMTVWDASLTVTGAAVASLGATLYLPAALTELAVAGSTKALGREDAYANYDAPPWWSGIPWLSYHLGRGGVGLGERLLDLRSARVQLSTELSAPTGDLFRPSTWSLGEDPTLSGYAYLTLEAFGSIAPAILGGGLLGQGARRVAASIAGPGAGVVRKATASLVRHSPFMALNAAQVSGHAALEIEGTIDELKAAPGGLYENVPAFKALVDEGVSPEVAEATIRQDAVLFTLPLSLGIGATGGYATSLFFNTPSLLSRGANNLLLKYGLREAPKQLTPGTAEYVLSRLPQQNFLSSFTRVVGRSLASGAEEGLEEVGESSAITHGLNLALGLDRPLTAGTFGDFLLAQGPGMALGGTGALRGEIRIRDARARAIAATMNLEEQAAKAGEHSQAIVEVYAGAAQGPTAEADPSAVAEVVDATARRVAADRLGLDPDDIPTIERMYVEPDALVEAHGEDGAAEVLEQLTGVPDGRAALAEAREAGRRVEVAPDKFIEYLKRNPEHSERVTEHTSIFEDGYTPAELRAYHEEIAAERDRALAADATPEGEPEGEGEGASESAPDTEPETRTSKNRPNEHRFVKAAREALEGRMEEGDITAHLALMRARIRVAARRSGVDPEEVFQGLELTIRHTASAEAGPDFFDPRVPAEEVERAIKEMPKRVRGLFHRYRHLMTIVLTPEASRATFVHEMGHFFFELLEAQAERVRDTIPESEEVEASRRELEAARAARNRIRRQVAETERNLRQTTDPEERASLESQIAEQKALLADANAQVEALESAYDDMSVRYARRRIVEDYEKAREWLNPEGGPITAEHLEKWAEAWEIYLMEGKAPSQALAAALRRYQLLMTEVYGEARRVWRSSQGAWVDADGNPVEAELSPEIVEVFERLLATENELRAAQAAMGDVSVFPTRKAMERALGRPVTAQEWYDHLVSRESAQAKLARRTYLAIRKSQLKESEKWYREKLARYRREARDEYEEQPARIMQLMLRGQRFEDGKVVDDGEGISLDHAAVVAAVGPELAKRFRTRKEGGVDPQTLAPEGVFESGADMLQQIAALPNKESWAKARAEQRMKQEHPDLLSDIAALRQEVDNIVRSDDGMVTLLAEVRKLADANAEVDGEILIEGRKEAARIRAGEKPLSELNRQELEKIRRTEQSLGDRALKAALRGESSLALNLKLQQLYNRYLYRFVRDNALRAARFQRDARRLLRRDVRARIGRVTQAGDPAGLESLGQVVGDAVDVLLEALGFTEPPLAQDRQRATVQEALDRLARFHGTEVSIDGELLGRLVAEEKPWEDLTLAEMEQVHNFFRAAMRLGKAARTVVDGYSGTLTNIDQAAAEFAAEVEAESPLRDPLRTRPTVLDRLKSIFTRIHAITVNPETVLMLASSGGIDVRSAAFRYIIGTIQKGKHEKDAWQRKLIGPLEKVLEKITPDMRKRWSEKIDSDALFPDHVRQKKPETVKDIFMLALYAGSAENLGVLQDGRGITPEQIRDAINEHLTKEDMDLVQEIWDIFDQTWAPSRDLEIRDTGVEPRKMQPTRVVTRFGTYRGGYFPAMYEWEAHSRGDFAHDPTSLGDLLGGTYIPVGTSHGHLIKRVPGFDGIVSTRLENLTRHANNVAHDLGFREAVKSAGRFLLHPLVAKTINERMGQPHYRQLLQWVRDVGRAGFTGETVHAEVLTAGLNMLRRNFSRAVLGLRPTVAMADVQNMFLPVISLGLDKGDLAASLAEFMSDPTGMYERAVADSPEVRVQVNAYRDALRRQFRAIDRGWGPGRRAVEYVNENAFIFMEVMQRAVVPIVYTAAYNQKLRTETVEAAEEAARVEDSAKEILDKASKARVAADAMPESTSEERAAKKEAQERADALRAMAEHMVQRAQERLDNVDKTARLYAESMVRRSFPLHNIVDRSGFARSPTALGAQILFYSFFSTMYQQVAHIVDPYLKARRRKEPSSGDFMKMAVRLVAHAIVANVLGDFILGRGPAMGDGDSDEERFVQWALRKAAVAPLLNLPFGTDLAYLVEQQWTGRRFGSGVGATSAGLDTLARLWQAVVDDRASVSEQRRFFSAARAVFTIYGIPTTPLGSLEYLATPSWDDYTLNAVEGLLLGRRGPEAPGSILTLGRYDRDPTGEKERERRRIIRQRSRTPEARKKRLENRKRKRERSAEQRAERERRRTQ